MQPDDGSVPCSSHAAYRLWRQWGYSIYFWKGREYDPGKHGYNERNRFCRRKKRYRKAAGCRTERGIRRYSFLSDRCIRCAWGGRTYLPGEAETGVCRLLWCVLLWRWLSADRCTWQCSVSSGAWGSGGSRRSGRQYHRAAETIG